MSIVNLNKRMTQDETEYSAAIRSSDSMIYVTVDKECENVPIITDPSGPDCLALHVGTCLYYKGCNWKIDSEKGVKIKAGTSVVLETAESLRLPANVYGLLYGNGKNIYRGAFISCGKIDPLFTGKLRIGIYNGGAKKIVLKTGDKLAYAVFFQTESDILSDQLSRATEVPSIREKLGVWTRLGRFVSDHSVIIATITSMLALAISIAKIFV